MNRSAVSRLLRVVVGTVPITLVVSAVILATVSVAGPGVLPVLGAVIAGVLWLSRRRRAAPAARPDAPAARPDAPARFLAAAVTLLPPDRRDWGAAMAAELPAISGRPARWAFAVGCARAALFPPPARARPATGWIGGAVGLGGAAACLVAAGHMMDTYPSSAEALTPLSAVLLVLVPAVGLLLALAAPPALTSSRVARRLGLWLGVATGVGLFLFSRAGLAELAGGAAVFLFPLQLLAFAVLPPTITLVTRSLRAGVQTIVWAYVFGTVATFPVYVVGSIRHHHLGGGLYLDGETATTIGTNLDDAVLWLFLVGPMLCVLLGVVGGVLAATVGRAIERVDRSAAPPV